MKLHFPNGSLAAPGSKAVVTPEVAGWQFSGLRVVSLGEGETLEIETGPDEVAVVFHQGFEFKQPKVLDGLLTLESDQLPTWSGLKDAVHLPKWSLELSKIVLKEPAGDWFLTVAAALEYMYHKPDGHLQATGRDVRGRKQYRYHPRFREVREETKYEHMMSFARALPVISMLMAIDFNNKSRLPAFEVDDIYGLSGDWRRK